MKKAATVAQLEFSESLGFRSVDSENQDFREFLKLPIVEDITKCALFNRLRSIRFLGAIDYLIWPSNKKKIYRHNRYEHSIRVAYLTYFYLKKSTVLGEVSKTDLAAALLHDIGHSPLSHSIETFYRQRFNLDHHTVSIQILKGEVKNSPQIVEALKANGVRPEAVIDILNGSTRNEIFHGPINSDTLDGIVRSKNYIARNSIDYESRFFLKNLIANNFEKIDDFWMMKDFIYKSLINGNVGYIADKITMDFLQSVQSTMMSSLDFYASEEAFRKKYHRLFEKLENVRTHLHRVIYASIPKERGRVFKIEPTEISLTKRYLNEKFTAASKFNSFDDYTIVDMSDRQLDFGWTNELPRKVPQRQ